MCSAAGRLRVYLVWATLGPPTALQPSRKKESCLWRVGGRVLGGTLGLWGGGMHSLKCLFSSVCEAVAFLSAHYFSFHHHHNPP